MKVKQYVLKEDVSITFTPDEIWELIVCCEGAKSYNKYAMHNYAKNSKGYNEHKELYDRAEKMQQKIISIRDACGVLEEVEV
jgi:hypothetical protein